MKLRQTLAQAATVPVLLIPFTMTDVSAANAMPVYPGKDNTGAFEVPTGDLGMVKNVLCFQGGEVGDGYRFNLVMPGETCDSEDIDKGAVFASVTAGERSALMQIAEELTGERRTHLRDGDVTIGEAGKQGNVTRAELHIDGGVFAGKLEQGGNFCMQVTEHGAGQMTVTVEKADSYVGRDMFPAYGRCVPLIVDSQVSALPNLEGFFEQPTPDVHKIMPPDAIYPWSWKHGGFGGGILDGGPPFYDGRGGRGFIPGDGGEQVSAVPTPGTLGLFASSLVALAAAARRRPGAPALERT